MNARIVGRQGRAELSGADEPDGLAVLAATEVTLLVSDNFSGGTG